LKTRFGLNQKFNLIALSTLGLLGLGGLIFGVAGENRPPLLTHIGVVAGPQFQAEFSNQGIDLEFDRPMDRSSVLAALSIQVVSESESTDASDSGESSEIVELNESGKPTELSKSVDSPAFDLVWIGDRARINFKSGLSPDTEYVLTIGTAAQSIYARNIGEAIEYRFKTQPLQLAFLRRAAFGSNSDDQIVFLTPPFAESVADSSENARVVFRAPRIKYYAATRSHLAVVTENMDKSNTLQIVDVDSGKTTRLEVGANHAITQIDIQRDILLILAQPVKMLSNIVIPDGPNVAKVYNFTTSELSDLVVPEATGTLVSAKLTADASGLVVRSFDGISSMFLMARIEDLSKFAPLGSYLDVSDFSLKGDKMLFVALPSPGTAGAMFPEIYMQTDQRQATLINDPNLENMIDPVFLNETNQILVSRLVDKRQFTRGLYAISQIDPATKAFVDIISWADRNLTLELPKLSQDDNYFAAEVYSIEQITSFDGLRNMGYQTKPYSGDLLIYDLVTGEEVTTLPDAISAQWL
jgi:hypothetical protein